MFKYCSTYESVKDVGKSSSGSIVKIKHAQGPTKKSVKEIKEQGCPTDTTGFSDSKSQVDELMKHPTQQVS